MGRPKLISGYAEIANAERMFRQSVKNRKPDFRYVALAIGASPLKPPRWAVWECIMEHDRTAGRPASNVGKLGELLDEVVRVYARVQFQNEDKGRDRAIARPSLRAAIIQARAFLERGGASSSDANDDWMKTATRAWNTEQETVAESYFHLDGWNTTSRINRVIEGMIGRENGYPTDLQTAFWMLEEIAREG